MAVVGESGSGKTTLLQLLSIAARARAPAASSTGCATASRAISRRSARPSAAFWPAPTGAYVHQDPALGLRMAVSAGANVGERLMAVGWRHYGRIRGTAPDWLDRVEIDPARIDDPPAHLFRRHAPAAADRPQPRHRSRAWSSWTSRPAASTCRCRRGCSTCCAGWSPSSGSRP